MLLYVSFLCFFFNDTATTEIYTLSLHDALPIAPSAAMRVPCPRPTICPRTLSARSEEHTSELPSHVNIVCRLLLEKKKKTNESCVGGFTSAPPLPINGSSATA